MKKKVVRSVDWKKTKSMFSGWGRNGNCEMNNLMWDVALNVAKGRMMYGRSREHQLRCKVRVLEKNIKWKLKQESDL